jgi:protein translocase SecG subunit
MNSLFNLVVVVQVVSAISIIGLVLLQHGKGADMGAAFGSGASGSLFGATGSSNFMSKSTGVAAAIFFSIDAGTGLHLGQPWRRSRRRRDGQGPANRAGPGSSDQLVRYS